MRKQEKKPSTTHKCMPWFWRAPKKKMYITTELYLFDYISIVWLITFCHRSVSHQLLFSLFISVIPPHHSPSVCAQALKIIVVGKSNQAFGCTQNISFFIVPSLTHAVTQTMDIFIFAYYNKITLPTIEFGKRNETKWNQNKDWSKRRSWRKRPRLKTEIKPNQWGKQQSSNGISSEISCSIQNGKWQNKSENIFWRTTTTV